MREPNPADAMGVAACVLLETLFTAMAQSGRGEEALEIIASALPWFDAPSFRHSARMKQAKGRVERLQATVRLLAQPAAPRSQ